MKDAVTPTNVLNKMHFDDLWSWEVFSDEECKERISFLYMGSFQYSHDKELSRESMLDLFAEWAGRTVVVCLKAYDQETSHYRTDWQGAVAVPQLEPLLQDIVDDVRNCVNQGLGSGLERWHIYSAMGHGRRVPVHAEGQRLTDLLTRVKAMPEGFWNVQFVLKGSTVSYGHNFRVGDDALHPALAWFDDQEWNSWELTTVPVTGHGREALAKALDEVQPGSYRVTLIGPGQQRALFDFNEAGEGRQL